MVKRLTLSFILTPKDWKKFPLVYLYTGGELHFQIGDTINFRYDIVIDDECSPDKAFLKKLRDVKRSLKWLDDAQRTIFEHFMESWILNLNDKADRLMEEANALDRIWRK